MNKFLNHDLLMRRLDISDITILGDFFEHNNRIEVTRFFHPFSMIRATAAELLKTSNKDMFFGMEDKGKLIAFSMLRGWDEGFDIPSFGIVVDYQKQGKGLGKKLTEWTLRWADQKKCEKVRLTSYEENKAAMSIYYSFGFKETSRDTNSNGLLKIVLYRDCPKLSLPVYVSTQCLADNTKFNHKLLSFYNSGLHNIELSNVSLDDEDNLTTFALQFQGKLMLHNFYFSKQKSLVLNLASNNYNTFNETLVFFKRAIDLSTICKAQYYSIHAGFCGNPIKKDTYGFILPSISDLEKTMSLERFVEGIISLGEYARSKNVFLLIENHVVTQQNIEKLLLSKPSDFIEFFRLLPKNLPVGILLDWGHWLVTSKTYLLNIETFYELNEFIKGIHLHTNDTVADQHNPFFYNDKHLKLIKTFNPDFISLEGHYSSIAELQNEVMKMEECLNEQ